MKIVVLGAGVIGVTTAWRLARDGHEVTVVDAADRVSRGASGANAGMIAPGHAYPWATPQAPLVLARSLITRNGRLRIVGRPRRDLVRWGLLFLRECTPARARRNALVKLELGRYSEKLLHAWAAEASIDYAARRTGGIYLYRTPAALEAAYEHTRLFRGHGREQLLLDRDELLRREPALDTPAGREFVGAVLDPADSSGDSERFTAEVAERCRADGVRFELGRTIVGLEVAGGRIAGARLADDAVIDGDAYVLSLGGTSAKVAATAGERLAIYPVKGYAATFPLRDVAAAPSAAGVDEEQLIAFSVQGDRLRLATGAEFAGESTDWTPASFDGIRALARQLFPGAADYEAGDYRVGLRPMTPDSAPVIGRGRYENLFHNTGHGHMGWTMACGSAQVVSDLVAGRTPPIATEPFRPRWGHA